MAVRTPKTAPAPAARPSGFMSACCLLPTEGRKKKACGKFRICRGERKKFPRELDTSRIRRGTSSRGKQNPLAPPAGRAADQAGGAGRELSRSLSLSGGRGFFEGRAGSRRYRARGHLPGSRDFVATSGRGSPTQRPKSDSKRARPEKRDGAGCSQERGSGIRGLSIFFGSGKLGQEINQK